MKFFVCLASVALASPTLGQSDTRDANRRFAESVLPIFRAECSECHGPRSQQGGLRLDSLVAVLRGGDSGRVVVAGKSHESALIRRIEGLDVPRMPMSAEALSAEAIATIRDWIDASTATDAFSESSQATSSEATTHWAYVAPFRPEPPALRSNWGRNEIDRFVLAKLEGEGLEPSPEASPEKLARRLSLDLIGLPPTLEQLDRLAAGGSVDELVDELLASPHYGERWARPWLDLARYADTNGYEKDAPRSIWKYRDWVIDALNRDLSFRDFTIEQLAGDMLEAPTVEQRIATGFHRNTLLNQEGGVEDEEARWETLLDRAETTAITWLGTSLGCARCHNHKYDPFTQEDYYRFLAFFDNAEYEILRFGQGEHWVQEPTLELPSEAQAVELARLRGEHAALTLRLESSDGELRGAQAKWEARQRSLPSRFTEVAVRDVRSSGGATLEVLDDGSILASGSLVDQDVYNLEAVTDLRRVAVVRLEVLPHESLPRGGPGRDDEGNFFLSDFELEVVSADGSSRAVAWDRARSDEELRSYSIEATLSASTAVRGWAVEPHDAAEPRPYPRQAVFLPHEPFHLERDDTLRFRIAHEMPLAARTLGRFRISLAEDRDVQAVVEVPAKQRALLEVGVTERAAEAAEDIAAAFRDATPLLDPVRERLAQIDDEIDELGVASTLVLNERHSYERPSTPFRHRGSFHSPGKTMHANVPGVLPPLGDAQMANRLGLARWIVSERNPLTARVTVNRIWETIFGRGLVATSDDFGLRGAPPSHPKLLDWLAVELTDNDWSLKHLIRTIVHSSTYRQSSRVDDALLKSDPYNLWLARGPRFRVEAEIVRDNALQIAGLLDPTLGGPSVFPHQPDGVWNRPYSSLEWETSEGSGRHRRGIYTFWRRTAPYPSMTTFDAPSRELCTAQRVRTNTPLQALTTLNDPVFFEAAQALARRIVSEGGASDVERIEYGYRLATARRPVPQEINTLERYLDAQRRELEADFSAAARIARTEDNAAELASWTLAANVLLNLDETLTKD